MLDVKKRRNRWQLLLDADQTALKRAANAPWSTNLLISKADLHNAEEMITTWGGALPPRVGPTDVHAAQLARMRATRVHLASLAHLAHCATTPTTCTRAGSLLPQAAPTQLPR